MSRRSSTTCRCCAAPLFTSNARTCDGRFVGICRSCESWAARERYAAKHPGARFYEDARRKYPVRAS